MTPYRTTLAAEAGDYSPYSAIVRRHLEYSFQFGAPQDGRGIDILEHVQSRAVKMIREVEQDLGEAEGTSWNVVDSDIKKALFFSFFFKQTNMRLVGFWKGCSETL